MTDPALRLVRPFVFCSWAEGLEEAADFVARAPMTDLSARLPADADERLRRMARLDADWHAESVRCFAQMGGILQRTVAGVGDPGSEQTASRPGSATPATAIQPRSTTPATGLAFLPARTMGAAGLAAFAEACQRRPANETWWLIFTAQDPQKLGPALAPFCSAVRRAGVRILFYAFDEASRMMPGFNDLAPHLDVLIHDEAPMADAGRARLRKDCLAVHRSWVANVVPFAAPFNESPEEKILFLGSQLGLTEHRKRQITYLQQMFKDRFVASHDHSVSVGDRFALNRFKVGFCPEGRKFTTPAMSRTHTDRPFWSGCLGLVPVSENSRQGGRLDELAEAGLLLRYPHGDLKALARRCEQALATSIVERRRIYEHFNRHETVGTVVMEAIAAAMAAGGPTR